MSVIEIKFASREEWLALRKNYIGGSDAGAIVGLNPYSSPFAVWAEKTGRTEGFAGNLITEVGSYLEDFVADLFTKETGKKVRRKNRMLVNDEYPFACADVDRMVVGEKALLECKTTNSFPVMRKLRDGEYPEQWYAQMTHYLAVTGLERAYLAVLINCRDFKIYTLERNEAEISALMMQEGIFWTCVANDTPPAIDGTEATETALQSAYPESDGSSVYLPELNQQLRQRAALAAAKKDLEKDITAIDNQIKAEMQEAEKAEFDGWSVTWMPQVRRQLDRKKLQEEHPDIDLSDYEQLKTTRVFRVTQKKGDQMA